MPRVSHMVTFEQNATVRTTRLDAAVDVWLSIKTGRWPSARRCNTNSSASWCSRSPSSAPAKRSSDTLRKTMAGSWNLNLLGPCVEYLWRAQSSMHSLYLSSHRCLQTWGGSANGNR